MLVSLLLLLLSLQVAGIHNSLAHLKIDNSLSIDDQTFIGYWKDITDLVDSIQECGRFTQKTAQELHKKLDEVLPIVIKKKHPKRFTDIIKRGSQL